MVFTYDTDTAGGQVRLLLNDVDATTAVFTDGEIAAFLALEGGAVKLAAAQAIDTNADDQALASKVLRDNQLTTDGAKLADSLRSRARSLREQHARETEHALEDGGYFDVIDFGPGTRPEHTGGHWS